jgi:acyl-coenzyme A synthetase/AMP-(fatty) acid ligase
MPYERLHDLLAAAPQSAPAIAGHGWLLHYRDLEDESRRLAVWLRDLGIKATDRVIISLSRPQAFKVSSFVYACSRAGAVFCIVHEQVQGPPLEHILRDAEPALVISDTQEVIDHAARLGIATSGPDADLEALAPEGWQAQLSPDDPACMIYTSGSTSRPKAVVSTHAQMIFVARAIQSQLRYQSSDVIYTTLPFSFDVGLYQLLLAAISGAQVWLPSADGAGALIVPELLASKATVLPAVPAVAEALAWAVRRSRNKGCVPSLRLLTSTGAAMPPSVLASLRERLPDLRIQLMYGLTECKRVAIMPVDGDLTHPGSAGIALPGTEIRIVDQDGRAVAPSVTGQIVVSGPHVMNGYWKAAELTAARFTESGLFTGDFGYLDEDGYLFIHGRQDDIYKENGYRVSAAEVEAAALELPAVRLAAVLPPCDGRSSVLIVVATADEQSVMSDLALMLEPFKMPKRCVVVEKMPLNHNGKIDKKALTSMNALVAVRPVLTATKS